MTPVPVICLNENHRLILYVQMGGIFEGTEDW